MEKTLIEELRSNAAGHPLDVDQGVMTKAAEAIESQAATIARYETTAENCDALRDKVAEQAREIESLNTRFGMACKDLAAIDAALDLPVRDYASTNREKLDAIAALKAQPGGVVIAEHLRNAHAFIENTEAFGAAASHGILECGGARWDIDASKAALDCLNSSPVTDNGVPE